MDDDALSGSRGSLQWEKLRRNRTYNHYKNMAGPMLTNRAKDNKSDPEKGEVASGAGGGGDDSGGGGGGGGSGGGDADSSPSWPRMLDLEYLIHRNRTADLPVTLNVGGSRYVTTWSLLERLPQTRLGKLRACRTEEEILKLCDAFDPDANEYSFERQPRNFNCVLSFLTTGKLHLGEETCVIAFSQVGHLKK